MIDWLIDKIYSSDFHNGSTLFSMQGYNISK